MTNQSVSYMQDNLNAAEDSMLKFDKEDKSVSDN